MDKLKDYSNQIEKPTIPSGIKSPDSENELQIVQPIKRHPQLKGLVRATDPVTGWMGWVEYSEPETPVVPNKRREMYTKISQLEHLIKLVDLGVFTEQELGVETLRAEIKVLFNELGGL